MNRQFSMVKRNGCCTLLLALMVLGCLGTQLQAQTRSGYYSRSQFLFAPPSTFQEGLLGFSNPANLTLLARPELRFFWSTDGSDLISLQDWGIFSAMPHLGFSVQRQKFGDAGVTDFKLSTGFGSSAMALGVGFGWASGDQQAFDREKLISIGTITRPAPYLSIGITGNLSLESSRHEGVVELGVRPLATPRLTLFADYAIQKDMALDEAPWGAGVALQLADGVDLIGRYLDIDESVTLGFSFNFGRNGLGSHARLDSDFDHQRSSYFLRSGGERRSFLTRTLRRNRHYVPFTLMGNVEYLKFKFLDSGGRFLPTLQDIATAATDPRVSAVVLNLSGMRIRPEHAWELRTQLQNFRQDGKRVIVFVDRTGMTGYHLASVADVVVLDPLGAIELPGYALSQTYFKGTLDKLGLGFDSWRFYEYKSANEPLSRQSMSEADREQNQAFIDDWYELTRSETCEARGFEPAAFDSLVNNESYFLAEQALAAGLVDTLARWSEKDDVIRSIMPRPLSAMARPDILGNALPNESWGAPPRIAVVYALGVCALDEGIRARWLDQKLRALGRDPSVRAIVVRVDSPGGDGLASDLVAEAIRVCRESKPVLISQGQVAASGGYWLSMYGGHIFAGPNTVTGSIGVIFGWLYDKSFGEKLGMTSDIVQRGEHADLGLGIRLPFTPLQIPARNLTPAEHEKAERIIRSHYGSFVSKVASGRDMSEERVREIAEGRIYSGGAALKIALVDEIGGLMAAIARAKKLAGLKPEDEVEVIEVPSDRGLFGFSEHLPLNVKTDGDPAAEFIKLMLEHNGAPLPVLVPGRYPGLRR